MGFTQIKFEELIEQLLQQYECVILPGFGGFIVRDSPCNFNASKDQLKPFARHIFFNPHLTENDGLLLNAIQKETASTYSEANTYCLNAIEGIKTNILSNGSLHFGSLGTFYKGQEHIWFAPSPALNLSLDSYGLYPIDIHGIDQVIEKIKVIETSAKVIPINQDYLEADMKPIETLDKPKPGIKPWLIAASIALIVHFIYLNVESASDNAHHASVVPELNIQEDHATENLLDTTAETGSDVMPEDTFSYAYPEEQTPVVEETVPMVQEKTELETVVAEQAPIIETPVISESVKSEDKSAVGQETEPIVNETIIAKYKMEMNANYHVKDLTKKGISARVELKDGWYLVMNQNTSTQ